MLTNSQVYIFLFLIFFTAETQKENIGEKIKLGTR